MLCQFMASGALICFVGYETILTLTVNAAKTVNSLFFLGYNIFELYIICRWCDEIRVQSQNIGEAVYCCGWESGVSLLPGVKQSVKLVIARANKPLAFTAGGINCSLPSPISNKIGEMFLCDGPTPLPIKEPEPMRGCILLWMGECVSIPWHQTNW
ncbi:Odorant receptor, partial [Operophtera brumata]